MQRGAMMEDVKDPAVLLSLRFDSLEQAVGEAKRATSTYLQLKRHKDMPDQIDWRIMDDTHLFPVPSVSSPCTKRRSSGGLGMP